MADNYLIHSTSSSTAKVEDRELSRTQNTRRILRPEIINNPNDPSASVKATILHQKAISKDTFEDIKSEPLSSLKTKDIGKLILDSSETKKLHEELQNLYSIHETKGVPKGNKNLVVGFDNEIIKVDSQRSKYIAQLIEQGHSEEVWAQLVKLQPALATNLGLAKIHEDRKMALEEFKQNLSTSNHEVYWQSFFETNNWIFGYGLNYQILKNITSQPQYGGQVVQGSGQNKGDFLNSTQGNVKFTVLVEIKRPNTPLLDSKEYRNDVFAYHHELSGGLSQLRVNARKWEVEGSTTSKNRDSLESQQIFTIKPKMLLIIGNTNQLTTRQQKESFELMRRSQSDIEILTFDELFERAKYIVHQET